MRILNDVVQVPVTDVKGIGGETSELLHEMGIYTVSHLLEHFPYRYEDYAMKDLAEVKHDERVTVEGKIHSAPLLNKQVPLLVDVQPAQNEVLIQQLFDDVDPIYQ